MRVVLVIPDAGPLISLAKADALALLLQLRLPIVLVDQVLFEVTRAKSFEDARRIDAFVRDNPEWVSVFQTEVGFAAAARRAAGGFVRQRGQGEAAIAEFLVRLDEVTGDPESPVLMVYEDSDIRKSVFVLPETVPLVSTKGLLLGLERRGHIPSAEAVWQAIVSAGRGPSPVLVDRPGRTAAGDTWW